MPSQLQAESDQSYMGFASRLDPGNLPEGILQIAVNVRLERGIAQPRKGCQRLTNTALNELTMAGSGLWVDSLGRDNIVMVFTDRLYLYRPEQGLDPSTGTFYPEATILVGTFPSGRTIAAGGVVDCVQALNNLIIFRGQYDTLEFLATLSNSAIQVGQTGLVTVTTIGAHGYSTGNEVSIHYSTHDNGHSAVDGNYIITVTSPTQFTFTFTNNTPHNFPASQPSNTYLVQRGKPPLIWNSVTGTITVASQRYIAPSSGTALTYITESVPPGDFGFYYQNRLVVKYSDQRLVVSDILELNFDVQWNNFLINQGGNDSIVGCLPWIENQFLVFMRNSIYVAFLETTSFIKGTSPGDKSAITVVTTELGCLARRTIVNAGQFVFFLSAKGVHLLTPQLDLKVVGNTMPLSEPVADWFQNLNFSVVKNSVAIYYNNRFFIAIPAAEDLRNSFIIIYNTLNKNWESIDTYPTGLYFDNLISASYQNQKRLYILTNFVGDQQQYGGVFLTEQREDSDYYKEGQGVVLPFALPRDINIGGLSNTINSFVRTREFTMKSLSEKRFSRGEFQFNNIQSDTITINASMHDPDSDETLIVYQFSGTSDGTVRPRIANRGSSIDFTVGFTNGRPALKGITVYGIAANRPMISQE